MVKKKPYIREGWKAITREHPFCPVLAIPYYCSDNCAPGCEFCSLHYKEYPTWTKMHINVSDKNARLIAAAPEMLELLKSTRYFLDQVFHNSGYKIKVAQIDELIAKIEGVPSV